MKLAFAVMGILAGAQAQMYKKGIDAILFNLFISLF